LSFPFSSWVGEQSEHCLIGAEQSGERKPSKLQSRANGIDDEFLDPPD